MFKDPEIKEISERKQVDFNNGKETANRYEERFGETASQTRTAYE